MIGLNPAARGGVLGAMALTAIAVQRHCLCYPKLPPGSVNLPEAPMYEMKHGQIRSMARLSRLVSGPCRGNVRGAEESCFLATRRAAPWPPQLVATGEHDVIIDGYVQNAVAPKAKGAPIDHSLRAAFPRHARMGTKVSPTGGVVQQDAGQ